MRAIRLSIAMATFNGARFLRDQLESFAAQTLLPHELVVGDDGSRDETLAILKDFSARAPFPVRVTRNPANLGFADNFLATAARCDGDWIAFSDQDDVAAPDKLAAIAERASRGDVSIVVHPLDRADEAGRPTGERIPSRLPPDAAGPMNLPAGWHHGGCGLAFDSRLVREIDWRARPRDTHCWVADGPPPNTSMPHDFWISLLGNLTGGVGTISQSLGIFRRHRATVTGDHLRSLRRDLAQVAGSSAYLAGERAALDAAQSLSALAEAGSNFAPALAAGAAGWRRKARVEAARAILYRGAGAAERFAIWTRLVAGGAYVGDRFAGAGARAMAKDALVAISGRDPQA